MAGAAPEGPPLDWRAFLRDSPVARVDPDDCWEAQAGLELLELTDRRAVGRIPVGRGAYQPMGIVHGGAMASLAETLASWATGAAVAAEGRVAVGLANHTSFFRPVTRGHLTGVAERAHAGRDTWVWEVALRDDEGRSCAAARITMAVRDPSRLRNAGGSGGA